MGGTGMGLGGWVGGGCQHRNDYPFRHVPRIAIDCVFCVLSYGCDLLDLSRKV